MVNYKEEINMIGLNNYLKKRSEWEKAVFSFKKQKEWEKGEMNNFEQKFIISSRTTQNIKLVNGTVF